MRKICVVTGTRAEYGLMYWLLKEIEEDPVLELQLAVTGMHLSPEFGMTVQQIKEDGFAIAECVEMLLSSDSAVGIAKSIGLGTIGFADAFQRLQPDIVLVLGDRFEILAAAQAAMVARIPIAHIHGGETTEGAFDEAIRHAVTKMAYVHFVAAEPYRRRVIQLGEAPERVHTVGAPGLDHLTRAEPMSREALEASLGVALRTPTLLVTYHPATLSERDPAETMQSLLDALDRFPEALVLATKSNADSGGRGVNERLEAYAAAHPERVRVYASLGQRRYFASLHHTDVVIGNSSSGIIEAPAVGVPTVNLGARQRGRLRAPSVLDVPEEEGAIAHAIRKALTPAFRARAAERHSPYGTGDAARRMSAVLREVPLGEQAIMKAFHDLPIS